MKELQSELFSNLTIPEDEDFGLYETVPKGFDNEVSLFISKDTITNDTALKKAGEFFDNAVYWNTYCRKLFIENSADSDVEGYFEFFEEEVPEVFEAYKTKTLILADKVNLLQFEGMASHGFGDEQTFVVDFTLGYDQILCVEFQSDFEYSNIAWES